jgi:hypothetical protein
VTTAGPGASPTAHTGVVPSPPPTSTDATVNRSGGTPYLAYLLLVLALVMYLASLDVSKPTQR